MSILALSLIIGWSVFWLGYAIHIYNAGWFYIRPHMVCRKKDRPLLFHLELFVSLLWAASGYAALFVFLSRSV